MMAIARFSETLVNFYQTTRSHIQEDSSYLNEYLEAHNI